MIFNVVTLFFFRANTMVAEELSTAALAGAIALEQLASSSLSAENQKRLNDMVAATTVKVVEEPATTTTTTTTGA